MISASGMQKTGNEAIVLTILGLVGIAISVTSLAERRNRFTWMLPLVGVVGLIFSGYYFFALRDQLSGVGDSILPLSVGAGIYVCIVASIVVLIGSFVIGLGRK